MQHSNFGIRTRTRIEWSPGMGDHQRLGWLSPDGKNYYHMIPKNASSYLGGILEGWSWQEIRNQIDITGIKSICLMRDPRARWISGITEFLSQIDIAPEDVEKNWSLLRNMLNYNPKQDAHTAAQTEFLHGFDLDQFEYGYLSEMFNIGEKLHIYFNNHGYTNELFKYDRQNSVEHDPRKQRIKRFITERMDEDVDFDERIKHYYQGDYELIEWIGRNKGWIGRT